MQAAIQFRLSALFSARERVDVCVCVYVCMYVCMCVRERERERESLSLSLTLCAGPTIRTPGHTNASIQIWDYFSVENFTPL